jgi:glycerol-3-phosphate dehydrogenase (NAD(P)+)
MHIQVVGAGSWGLALACRLAKNGHAVSLWCRSADVADRLRQERQRPEYLPGILLPEGVEPTTSPAPGAAIVVWVTPSHALREISSQLGAPRGAIQVSASKGIEQNTLQRMSEILAQTVPGRPIVALTGPSHAEEVARELPASLVAAGADTCACAEIQDIFFAASLRIYTSADIIGAELGGAVKNVVAIAAGASDGLGLGDNAKAALITRGLAEIARLGAAMGAEAETFAGLSGL